MKMDKQKQLDSGVPDVKEKMIYVSALEACQLMQSDMRGLSNQQVQERLEKYGRNELAKPKSESMMKKFVANFTSLMALLLWAGGLLALLSGAMELGIAIFCVNLINGCFSFFQEFKAEKATNALQQMLPSKSRVVREGKELQIPSEEIVPGDILVLEEGDKISADARVLRSNDFQADQSTLTGESNPIRKTGDALKEECRYLDAENMIFSGTSAAAGTCRALVVSTGMESEFGKIANLTQTTEKSLSPLQKELNILTKQIALISTSIGIVFFLIATFLVQDPVMESFLFALGMIVAFIPEGLLPAVTLSLALAVQKMAKENALVKKLSAVETLGCTNVICSDKTGTLTQNEMTVNHLWTLRAKLDVTGEGYAPLGAIFDGETQVGVQNSRDLELLLSGAALCSNARLIAPEAGSERYTVLGDPTEACLGVVAQKGGIDLERLNDSYPRIMELPFDSRRKRMTTIHQLREPLFESNRLAFIKGSPKEVMELCEQCLDGTTWRKMEEADREAIMQANDAYAREGLRVLAVACRPLKRNDKSLPETIREYTPDTIECQLTFLGLVAMQDPPRREVKDAVALCRSAGIKIVMITGDYGLTAESIARKIGIIEAADARIISGTDLAKMDDGTLKEALQGEVVFARMAPEQKYRIVCALQEMGNIVAVTGDGVNDSPALKKADIGIAMGITGTDVAKEAADMILSDDNFATIVRAIEEGRSVYNNIRKFLRYIFDSNTSEAAASVAYLLSGGLIPLPLTIMQILTIDIGTDMVPALGLGAEASEASVMRRPPRSSKERLLNKNVMLIGFIWYGLLGTIFALGGYFLTNVLHGWPFVPLAQEGTTLYAQATTMMLAGVVFSQIGMVMNNRTDEESVLKRGLFTNRYINAGIVIEILILLVIMYVPFFHGIFNTAPIGPVEWLYLLCIPFIVFGVEELRKKWLRQRSKERSNEK
ncbi:MAG TPA: cation-transporting P-type ATPase [Candidatus Fimiplasma intestinipullorum]|uniref:Cation-transporting P-type ATPase n=1 Tax=Candidatus Fimiplasma intestinipullorum TaxID=2840825 RepID=A0A9D1KZ88_9FIRM|nr:cation-transporting P-type ATPase [Candidatus Fimiplasma intestinipullorum]